MEQIQYDSNVLEPISSFHLETCDSVLSMKAGWLFVCLSRGSSFSIILYDNVKVPEVLLVGGRGAEDGRRSLRMNPAAPSSSSKCGHTGRQLAGILPALASLVGPLVEEPEQSSRIPGGSGSD